MYVFRDATGRPLYVGTSKDIRTRVRHYFVASEQRSRMAEMVGLAERVDAIVCAHALEAEVRELRMIAAHKPPYNRRSRFPERGDLAQADRRRPYPRLSVVRVGARGRRLLPRAVRVAASRSSGRWPRCTTRCRCGSAPTSSPTTTQGSACALAEMDRCGAPCEGRIIPGGVRRASPRWSGTRWRGDPRPLTEPLLRKVARLSAAGRYEQAATVRDRAGTFARACARVQRLAGLTSVEHLVAARPDGTGGWELAVVRRGRLVAAGVAARGAAVRPYVAALVATAESVLPGVGPLPCATAEETERILRWLEEPGTRLVELTGTWSCPAHGAGGLGELLDYRADPADPTGDRRRIRPIPRPAR